MQAWPLRPDVGPAQKRLTRAECGSGAWLPGPVEASECSRSKSWWLRLREGGGAGDSRRERRQKRREKKYMSPCWRESKLEYKQASVRNGWINLEKFLARYFNKKRV